MSAILSVVQVCFSVNRGLGAVGQQGRGQGSGKCGRSGIWIQGPSLTWWTFSSGTNLQLETVWVKATWIASVCFHGEVPSLIQLS